MVSVDNWAVLDGEIYRGEIKVNPNQDFIYSVRVCVEKTGYWAVALNLLDDEGVPIVPDNWIRTKGHDVSAGSCMRADFTLSYPRSGKIVTMVYCNGNLEWKGEFDVVVVSPQEKPQVYFENSTLVCEGVFSEPGSTVEVAKGEKVMIKSDVKSNVNTDVVVQCYDQSNNKVLASKTVNVGNYLTGVVLEFTAEENAFPLLRALHNGEVVGVDGSWVLEVKEGGRGGGQPSQPGGGSGGQPSQPNQPSHPSHPSPTQPTQTAITVTPYEAVAAGLILGSLIVLAFHR